jgi:hypothetical protein
VRALRDRRSPNRSPRGAHRRPRTASRNEFFKIPQFGYVLGASQHSRLRTRIVTRPRPGADVVQVRNTCVASCPMKIRKPSTLQPSAILAHRMHLTQDPFCSRFPRGTSRFHTSTWMARLRKLNKKASIEPRGRRPSPLVGRVSQREAQNDSWFLEFQIEPWSIFRIRATQSAA